MDRRRRNIKREKERKVERVKVKIQNILKVSAGQRRWRRLASRKKNSVTSTKHICLKNDKKKQYKKVDIDYLAAKTN